MSINIILRNETFTVDVEIGGAVAGFTLRRPTPEELREIDLTYLTIEKPDYLGYGIAKSELVVVGWDARVQHGGRPLPFDKSLIRHLPDDVRAAVNAKVDGHAPLAAGSGASLPPSSAGSSGNAPTPA